jgi:hypothetical protein
MWGYGAVVDHFLVARAVDHFLTMEGRGCLERSQKLTGGHEMPANRKV